MTTTVARYRLDVFCHVVDNFGDAAVCWRLARSLSLDHGFAVRLWIDQPEVLAALQPAVDPSLDRQRFDGVEICRASSAPPCTDLPDVAIDAFGHGLPEAYAAALAARRPRALWIVLEYLSAEDWASGVHRLASPHPVLDIRRFFFCPGFGAESGGVLCEPGLLDARQAFAADAAARVRLWDRLGFEPPPHGTTAVSLFGYPNPGLPGLLDSMAAGPRPVRLALAPGLLADAAASWFRAAGRPLPGRLAGQAARAGALEARWLPFLPQPDYDHLLWASDFNFVRGEDSVVRGVWAARPLCWQLYPQDEDAQGPKLEAFIGAVVRHAVDEPGSTPGHSPDGIGPGDPDRSWAALQRAWNGCGVPAAERSRQVAAAWRNAFAELPVLQRRASRFAERLAAWPDLAARLAGFCREQLK